MGFRQFIQAKRPFSREGDRARFVPWASAIFFLIFAANAEAEIRVTQFEPTAPICRADRPYRVVATLANEGEHDGTVRVELVVPPDVQLLDGERITTVSFANGDAEVTISWTIKALREGEHTFEIVVSSPD